MDFGIKRLLAILVFACCTLNAAENKVFTVSNPLDSARGPETIEIDFSALTDIDNLTKENAAVFLFAENGYQDKTPLVSQVIFSPDKKTLLFQSSFGPKESKKFAIMALPAGKTASSSELSTFTGFYPKRDDDIAWENDKMAARMYGKGLEWETICCGIDLWCKEVARPIVEQKYFEYIEKKMSYHESRGIGGDYYKVGPTLGCGGSTIFKDGKLFMPNHNFAKHTILANGPIRSTFEIEYEQWDADGLKASETMVISVDLGSYLCKVEAIFNSSAGSLPVAAGIITREQGGQYSADSAKGTIGYWQPKEKFGTIFCGVVVPSSTKVKAALAQDHILLATEVKPGSPFTYYAGGGWDKTGEIDCFDTWNKYLASCEKSINNPLIVTQN